MLRHWTHDSEQNHVVALTNFFVNIKIHKNNQKYLSSGLIIWEHLERKRFLHKDMYARVYKAIIHQGPKLGAIHMYIK